MEQFVSTDMSVYTGDAFYLKDKVQNCAGVASPALTPSPSPPVLW